MLFPELTFILEVIGAGFLAVVLVYAIRLNRRLSTLQEDKAEFERLLSNFTESTTKAEISVSKLKTSATDTAQSLQDSVTRAQVLRDDLSFLIDRGNDLANQLENAIREARPETQTRGSVMQEPTSREALSAELDAASSGDDEDVNPRKSKSDLLKALEGMR